MMPNQVNETERMYTAPQLTGDYDYELKMIVVRWNPRPRPCFNPELLQNLCDVLKTVRQFAKTHPVAHFVIASDLPGIFNLGGDLATIAAAVQEQNRPLLQEYAHLCIQVVFDFWNLGNLPITTYALIEGDCFGGGFEAALAADYLIAEHRARFAFPEIKFNLFPGMGAYSFLERRVGVAVTEKLLTSGTDYSASEMYVSGIVETVITDNDGLNGLEALIEERRRNGNGRNAILKTRRQMCSVTLQELQGIVEIWVDAAMQITDRDLRLVRRLTERQTQIIARKE